MALIIYLLFFSINYLLWYKGFLKNKIFICNIIFVVFSFSTFAYVAYIQLKYDCPSFFGDCYNPDIPVYLNTLKDIFSFSLLTWYVISSTICVKISLNYLQHKFRKKN